LLRLLKYATALKPQKSLQRYTYNEMENVVYWALTEEDH